VRRIAAICLAFGLTACSGTNPFPQPSPSPPPAQLLGENLLLLPGPERAIRFGIEPAGPSASIIIGEPTGGPTVSVCALASVTASLPPLDECVTAAPGVRERIAATTTLGAVAVVSRQTAASTVDVVLEYPERSRAVTISMPLIRRPPGVRDCRDNRCNPFFELAPARGGRFAATARWIGGGRALLQLLSGRVLGRSLSATGVPYAVPARADGASPLSISARLSAPGEYALALSQTGPATLEDVVIRASWPG
jgi:hypothetical protein